MKRKLLLLTTLLLIIGYACKKDKFEETNLPADNNTVTIGNYSGMTLINHDTTLRGKYNAPPETYEIDLNNDLLPDLRFSHKLSGSPAMGVHPTCEILCLNPEVELYGHFKGDTTFSYTTRDTVPYSNGKIYLYIYHYYSCFRRNATDTIEAIKPDKFVVPGLIKGSTLQSDNFFKRPQLMVYSSDWVFPPDLSLKGDTTIYSYEIPYSQCDNFSQDKISYIGIKMRINNMEKIGWLKIMMSSGGYGITILESAIQR